MKKQLVEFLKRGLIFGGFGPIIVSIIYFIISFSETVTLNAGEILVAVISSYLLTFIQAGATIFNQIENWSTSKSFLVYFSILYIAYLSCYLVNTWIPFEWLFVLFFTISFAVVYLIVWFTVYFIAKNITKKLNEKL